MDDRQTSGPAAARCRPGQATTPAVLRRVAFAWPGSRQRPPGSCGERRPWLVLQPGRFASRKNGDPAYSPGDRWRRVIQVPPRPATLIHRRRGGISDRPHVPPTSGRQERSPPRATDVALPRRHPCG